MLPPPPAPTLFPYTTLFRSGGHEEIERPHERDAHRHESVHQHLGRIEREMVRAVGLRRPRSEEHTSELQSHHDLVCRLLLEKKNVLPTNHSSNTSSFDFIRR